MVQLTHPAGLLRRVLPLFLLAFLLLLLLPERADAQSERPEVLIIGGEQFVSRGLREAGGPELRALRTGEGGAADAADAAYNIEQWIRQQGYPEARVRVRMINETPQGELRVRSSREWESVDRLELVIEPGGQTLLGEITFPGASSFEADRLRAYFPQGSGSPFRRRDIQEGVGQVSRLYEVNGYAESVVGPPKTTTREVDGSTYRDVTVPVEEGPRYLIRRVLVRSEALEQEELSRLEELIRLKGEPFFPRQATRGALTLRKALGTQGYRATVDTTTELDSDGNAQLTYTVDPGPKLILQEVVVSNRGEDPLRTKRSFIRSFLPLKPGDPVDFGALEETESELYGLGTFALVDVTARETSSEVEESAEELPTIVDIAVQELRTQFLEVSAGWGSYEQLRGSLTFTDRNLFGRGRSWTTAVEGSFKTYGASMSIADTVLFGPASTVALTGSYRYRDAVSYDRTVTRGEVSFAYRSSRFWTLRSAYAFSRSRVTEVEGEIPGIEDTDLATGRILLAGEYDSRDSVVIPRRGSYFLFSPLLAAPFLGSELLFTGANSEVVGHVSFLRRFTLSLSGAYRIRYRIGTERALPIQERLFLGGANSVRSFTLDTLGLVNSEGTPQGGMSSLEATAELRSRIVGELHGALFYDYGYLGSDSFTLSGDSGHALGFGLRYYLPVGPIRLDYAYNPGERYAADRPWALHLAVGFSY